MNWFAHHLLWNMRYLVSLSWIHSSESPSELVHSSLQLDFEILACLCDRPRRESKCTVAEKVMNETAAVGMTNK
jgi:hypothetical protein